jgi:hypothetical protein
MATAQHNIQAVSVVYQSIRLSELASFLDLSARDTEVTVATMIASKQLRANIDQVSQLVYFLSDAAAPLHERDHQISATCNAVIEIGEKILQLHPQLRTPPFNSR